MSATRRSRAERSRASRASSADAAAVTWTPNRLEQTGTHLAGVGLVVHQQHVDALRPRRSPRRDGTAAGGSRGLCGGGSWTAGIIAGMGRRTENAEPCPSPSLRASHGAAVQLDEVAHDRRGPGRGRRGAGWCCCRPGGSGRRRRARNSGAMPMPVSVTRTSIWRVAAAPGRPRLRPPRGVNLTALDSRFQTTCWRRSGSPLARAASGSSRRSTLDALGVGGGADGVDGGLDRLDQVHAAATFSRSLPVMMREMSSRSSMIWPWARALRSMAGHGAPEARLVELAVAQEPGPAEDGVERRAQLVGDGAQELVLERGWPPRPRGAPPARWRRGRAILLQRPVGLKSVRRPAARGRRRSRATRRPWRPGTRPWRRRRRRACPPRRAAGAPRGGSCRRPPGPGPCARPVGGERRASARRRRRRRRRGGRSGHQQEVAAGLLLDGGEMAFSGLKIP